MPHDASQQAYCQTVGTSSTNYPWIDSRDPTSNDVFYPIGKFWLNQVDEKLWYLNKLSNTSGQLQATWILVVDNGAVVDFIVDTGTSPVFPDASGNVSILGGTGAQTVGSLNTITINTIGGGLKWIDVTSTSASMSINTGYVSDNAGVVSLSLPSSSSFGDVIAVSGNGAGGWSITQAAGQQIHFNSGLSTTLGAAGSVSSTDRYDCIYLRCQVANTIWTKLNFSGNLTVV